MFKISCFKTIPFFLIIVLFASCDKEFSVVGEDVVGDNSFDIEKAEYGVVAYNEKIEAVQSNNLETNSLGVYRNPSFGTTTATFVTQLTMASVNPTFDETAKIKSVVLSVPYFSTKTATATDGSGTYVLDSIYGPEKAKMKLSIYESGYFMRDLDPEEQLSQPQKYYNDQFTDFYSKIKPLETASGILNDSTLTSQNTEFFFDPAEHVATVKNTDGTTTTTRTKPGMELSLNKEFFKTKILDAPEGSLTDNVAFKDYFRGLFFNIEETNGNEGSLALINFKAGKITITYTEMVNAVEVEKTFVLNLTGNSVNLLAQTNTDTKYSSATDPLNVNKENGDANLYLKGGEGSMAVLKLFKGNELDVLRKSGYLINQAEVTIYLNEVEMKTSPIARRVYLYDYTNNTVLIDYADGTTVASDTKFNKYVFGGILSKDKNGAYFYKFRITDHIRNLVKDADATNVELGLVVTEDINKFAFYALKDKEGIPLLVPMASVMNPLGAIVFGNNIPADNGNYAKRLKFEIYYTKPN